VQPVVPVRCNCFVGSLGLKEAHRAAQQRWARTALQRAVEQPHRMAVAQAHPEAVEQLLRSGPERPQQPGPEPLLLPEEGQREWGRY